MSSGEADEDDENDQVAEVLVIHDDVDRHREHGEQQQIDRAGSRTATAR